MSPLRSACLILAMMVSLLSADACFAQTMKNGTTSARSVVLSGGRSAKGSAATNSKIVGTTGGEVTGIGFRPAAASTFTTDEGTSVVQSAGCGTIAPMDPLQGAGNHQSPMIATPDIAQSSSHRLPPIPTLLFFTLTITASAWGLRDMAKRRRVTIINAGVVAAAVVTAAGFTWSLFYQEEVEYGHFTQAGEAATDLAYLR